MPVTAARSINLATNTAEALPQLAALKDLHAHGNQFYKGALTLIAGQPASGKSAFALWLVENMGTDVLYFSADSDAATMLSRLAAFRTGTPASQVRDSFADEQAMAYYQEVLQESRVTFCYHGSPDARVLEEELDAYVELYDKWPDVVVVDNLLDFYADHESETAGYKQNLLYFKEMARDTHSAFIVLHHCKEGMSEPDKPGSLKSIQGMVGQTPAAVYTVARVEDQFKIAPVKDRFGPDDKSGATHFTLNVDLSTCRFEYQAPLAYHAAKLGSAAGGLAPTNPEYYQDKGW